MTVSVEQRRLLGFVAEVRFFWFWGFFVFFCFLFFLFCFVFGRCSFVVVDVIVVALLLRILPLLSPSRRPPPLLF